MCCMDNNNTSAELLLTNINYIFFAEQLLADSYKPIFFAELILSIHAN